MQNSKFTGDKKALIVKKTNVPETLRNIPHGTCVRFTRRELSNRDTTVHSAVSRLNSEAGAKEYYVEIDPNDGSFLISRK